MQPPAELARMLEPADFDARPPVEFLVSWAQAAQASDLHLRPTAAAVEVLTRRDGVLQHSFNLPKPAYDRLLVGLKNMARLASYRKSTPQDGRLKVGEQEVRVATGPTHFGEKVVLRLMAGRRLLELDELGLLEDEQSRLWSIVDQPQGLVLATGPAGSGKTTTLLAVMQALYRRFQARLGPTPGATLNVVTLEDPVESVVPEFTHTEIHAEMGMTFASGLRSLLRQDPEIILVGEIRDPETAAAVIQTSLTGHLVFSTLHTRDSVGVIPRMLELGVQGYQLSASLAGVIYQRLLRRLCTCRVEEEPGAELRQERRGLGMPDGPSFRPQGCPQCQGTGYSGRLAVPELLEVDENLRQGILERSPLSRLREQAEMISLREAALRRVALGLTAYAEVVRVIPLEKSLTSGTQAGNPGNGQATSGD